MARLRLGIVGVIILAFAAAFSVGIPSSAGEIVSAQVVEDASSGGGRSHPTGAFASLVEALDEPDEDECAGGPAASTAATLRDPGGTADLAARDPGAAPVRPRSTGPPALRRA